MKLVHSLKKMFLVCLLACCVIEKGKAQCTTGPQLTVLNPNTGTFQTQVINAGGAAYFTFQGNAGSTYLFTFCSNGGSYTGDPYLTITDNTPTPIAFNDDFCSLGSQITWNCASSGLYRLYVSGCCPCANAPPSVLAYGCIVCTPAVPPVINSFSPALGCAGYTEVLITGTDLNGTLGVEFGGIPAASYVLNSPTQITAVPANGNSGPVTVNTFAGSFTTANSFSIYQPAANFLGGSVAPYIVNPSCALSNNGLINLLVTPANNYQYLWNTGDTTHYLDPILSGTYSVLITTNTECVLDTYVVTPQGNNCGNINGTVYNDLNFNCTKDLNESAIVNAMIVANPGNHITFTDANGLYGFNGLAFGNYTISRQGNLCGSYTVCNNNIAVNLNNVNANQLVDFADSVNATADFQVQMSGTCLVVPDANKHKVLKYKHNNAAAGTSTGIIYMVMDSINHYLASVPSHTSISNDTVFWNVNNITTLNNDLDVHFVFPNTYTQANIFPCSIGYLSTGFIDCNQDNNHAGYTIPFCNAFDPNQKIVNPKGLGVEGYLHAFDPATKLMTYEIQFQNTGNAPAYNIVVEDTLSDKLDLTTFQVIDYSHSYQLEVINNQVLKWKFYNIMLPDSNTNEPASHGHIIYQVRQLPTNMSGDVIKNKAHIYFDFNPAIITNETVNTLTMVEGMNEVEQGAHIVIYPNPATDVVYIESEREFTELRVYDAQMKLLRTIQGGNTRSLKMNTSALGAGLYYIKTNNGQVKKLLIADK